MKRLRQWLLACLLAGAAASAAHAHLVVSQRGTLNIVGDGAYMVLSLPVSSLSGFDDDHDGLLSINELRAYGASIESQIKQGVSLDSDQGRSALEGIMLNTAPPESTPTAPSTHLVVLGRFAIDPQAAELKLALRLFGTRADEQTEQIAVMRGAQSQLITLTPEHPQGFVLPSAWASFAEQARLGAIHVLTGADHLLFLLVVLAAAWNLRQVVLALTCFTAGHAVTLVACVWYGLSVPASVVEPAIAATIVGMALFDRWSAHRSLTHPVAIRLTLVFACALIHGLGLAGALSDFGVDGMGKVVSLIGFNVGIELGQIAVALTAALVMRGVRQLGGPFGMAKATRLASYVSMALGSFWFFQRALG
ncbi:MAG: HupE/UreJ family protein [Rhodoferax sp.]|uniref:HupE/UreJ family protein n=1 Tax=Rhodoferax sp. TaxID=50421 RepID=UPI001B5D1444|nr:HupE/UreJ family protein [Rhodoferax sp.]MBP9738043.1 HupE/UreJ family protein [Rhodoferax sp.]